MGEKIVIRFHWIMRGNLEFVEVTTAK